MAYEYNLGKYQCLIFESQQRGGERGTYQWSLVEGFPGQSLQRALGMLGVRGQTIKNLLNNILKQAETAFRWLWLKKLAEPGWLGRGKGAEY